MKEISKELLELKHKKLIERINKLINMLTLLSSTSDFQASFNTAYVIKAQYERMYNAVIESQDYEKYASVEDAIVEQLGKLELALDRFICETHQNCEEIINSIIDYIKNSATYQDFHNAETELDKANVLKDLVNLYAPYISTSRIEAIADEISTLRFELLLKKQIKQMIYGTGEIESSLSEYTSDREKELWGTLFFNRFGKYLEPDLEKQLKAELKVKEGKKLKIPKEGSKKFNQMLDLLSRYIYALMKFTPSLEKVLESHINENPFDYIDILNAKVFNSSSLPVTTGGLIFNTSLFCKRLICSYTLKEKLNISDLCLIYSRLDIPFSELKPNMSNKSNENLLLTIFSAVKDSDEFKSKFPFEDKYSEVFGKFASFSPDFENIRNIFFSHSVEFELQDYMSSIGVGIIKDNDKHYISLNRIFDLPFDSEQVHMLSEEESESLKEKIKNRILDQIEKSGIDLSSYTSDVFKNYKEILNTLISSIEHSENYLECSHSLDKEVEIIICLMSILEHYIPFISFEELQNLKTRIFTLEFNVLLRENIGALIYDDYSSVKKHLDYYFSSDEFSFVGALFDEYFSSVQDDYYSGFQTFRALHDWSNLLLKDMQQKPSKYAELLSEDFLRKASEIASNAKVKKTISSILKSIENSSKETSESSHEDFDERC